MGALASLAAVLACSARPVASARDMADANDTGATLEGRTEDERAVLAQLPRLPTGKPQRVRGTSVVADEPYEAASGRRCRTLHLQDGAQPNFTDRLACTNGKQWFFVPNVFGPSGGE
jgi:hypothetical protein